MLSRRSSLQEEPGRCDPARRNPARHATVVERHRAQIPRNSRCLLAPAGEAAERARVRPRGHSAAGAPRPAESKTETGFADEDAAVAVRARHYSGPALAIPALLVMRIYSGISGSSTAGRAQGRATWRSPRFLAWQTTGRVLAAFDLAAEAERSCPRTRGGWSALRPLFSRLAKTDRILRARTVSWNDYSRRIRAGGASGSTRPGRASPCCLRQARVEKERLSTSGACHIARQND